MRALLWVELSEDDFCGESGLRITVGMGDGARYWRVFWALLAWIEN